jgi:hypothetical protein
MQAIGAGRFLVKAVSHGQVTAPLTEGRDEHGSITDDELAALALAADPDQPLAKDAIPLHVYLATEAGPLPEWYMAPVMARHSGGRRRAVILGVIGALLLIEAFGLCSTYGQFPFH